MKKNLFVCAMIAMAAFSMTGCQKIMDKIKGNDKELTPQEQYIRFFQDYEKQFANFEGDDIEEFLELDSKFFTEMNALDSTLNLEEMTEEMEASYDKCMEAYVAKRVDLGIPSEEGMVGPEGNMLVYGGFAFGEEVEVELWMIEDEYSGYITGVESGNVWEFTGAEETGFINWYITKNGEDCGYMEMEETADGGYFGYWFDGYGTEKMPVNFTL